MATSEQQAQLRQIRIFLQVAEHFDTAAEAERRIGFLVEQVLLARR
ncbi:MAG: hypothetical protein V4812_03090 [Pseudomonadota bacterium]